MLYRRYKIIMLSLITTTLTTVSLCSIIYDKIDRDRDGVVTEAELRDWIKHVQNRYIWSDTERQWLDHEVNDDTLLWEDYKKRTYGFIDGKGQICSLGRVQWLCRIETN